jgi:hypothetical protein
MYSRFKYLFTLSVIFLSSTFFTYPVSAATLASQLSGRILLQVENKGEAWYVNPKDQKKYYLGKPDDAYALMRQLSLGISEKEFSSWSKGAPSWAKGKLYIRPQSHGEAYYVDLNFRWHYLGRANDAWLLFRAQGMGISNSDLAKITSASVSATSSISTSNGDYIQPLTWSYNLENFRLDLALRSSLNTTYKNATKAFYYTGNTEPVDAREQFYAIFFNKKTGDTIVKDLVVYAKSVAAKRLWTKDQTAEFLISLVQYIPYDKAKLNQNPLQPNYPYETLYRNAGICSDKTFLTVAILRELGYGAAILDFPSLNHSAAGISCPLGDSINNSGYCYVETTNYFQIGVIPPSISGGQAVVDSNGLANLFDSSRLNKTEIYQKTTGLVYQGVANVKKKVADLQTDDAWIQVQKVVINDKNTALDSQQNTLTSQQNQLLSYQNSGNITAYNNLVETYNLGVNKYNADLEAYRNELAIYNSRVDKYNEGLRNFYNKP